MILRRDFLVFSDQNSFHAYLEYEIDRCIFRANESASTMLRRLNLNAGIGPDLVLRL